MKILFITRKFPPMKGGMENVSYELYNHLSKTNDVILVKWNGSNKWLPLMLPIILMQSLFFLLTNKIDVIYLQDGLLAPLGIILKIFRKPIVVTIHGLDITYKNKLYQFLIPGCIKQLDRVICISQATKDECINRGILIEKSIIAPNGISDDFYMPNLDKNQLKVHLSNEFNIDLSDKKIILSVGRLVERKGLHWFIENVLPEIIEQNQNIIYLIAGDGPFREKIREDISKNGLEDFIIMLGKVEYNTLKSLYNVSDVFAMPNIPVKGDMEGFGIVILEAASCGVPVVASNLEGMKAAIKNEKNGFLVQPCKSKEFADTISKILKDSNQSQHFGKQARIYTLNHFSWDNISKDYVSIFQDCMNNMDEVKYVKVRKVIAKR